MRPVLHGFYSDQPDAVRAALRHLARADTPERARVVQNVEVPFAPDQRPRRDGLWSEPYFGPRHARDPDAWAVIELPSPMFHHALLDAVAARLGARRVEVDAVLARRAWWDDGRVRFPPGHPGADSALSTPIDEWPPFPPDAAQGGGHAPDDAPDEPDGEAALAEWRRARGIDPDAVARDDERWRDAAYEATGSAGLARVLRDVGADADTWLVHRVPVPPVTERPLEPRPGGVFVAGARSRALADVFQRAARLKRLVELDAPPVVLAVDEASLQHAVDALLTGEPSAHEAHDTDVPAAAPPTTPTWPVPARRADLVAVTGLAFVGPDRALIDFPTATLEVELSTGRLLRRFASGGLALAGVFGRAAVYRPANHWRFAVYDLSAGAWSSSALADTLPFAFEEVHEQAFVVDLTTRRRHGLREIGDYPAQLVLSPCGRYLCARDKHGSGGIFHFDGELRVPIEEGIGYDCDRVLDAERGVVKASGRTLSRLECGEIDGDLLAFAIDRSRDRWRMVWRNGVFDTFRLDFRFRFDVVAAAFDPDGRELLVAGRDVLWWVTLDPAPAVRRAFDLRSLHPLFIGPRGSRVRADALNAVLFTRGTLADLDGADVAALAPLTKTSSYDEPAPIGRAAARSVLSLACVAPAGLSPA